MATSGTISSTLTAREIINAATEHLGYKDIAQELDAADAASCLRSLNFMLKSMQADGCNLWRASEVSITWPADTAEVTLETNYLDLADVRVRENSIDRLLTRWEAGDYNSLPNKTASGSPTIYNLVKTRATLQMRVWPVPSSTVTLYAQATRVMEDVTNLNQNLDIPQEWLETVWMVLADRLPLSFKAGLSPIERQEVKALAASMYSALREFDRPASYILRRA